MYHHPRNSRVHIAVFLKSQGRVGVVEGKNCITKSHNGLDPSEKYKATSSCSKNISAQETQKEFDPCFDAVKISIKNCKRPGCKHSTEKRACIWPQPCPADCFQQFPPSTESPNCLKWPIN